MRPWLAVVASLCIVLPVMGMASASEARDRRYDFGLSPSCTTNNHDEGSGNGAGCFMLDGSAHAARVSLTDDTWGPMRSTWMIELSDGRVLQGTFCGSAEIEAPVGATFLAVWVEGSLLPDPSCIHDHGAYTSGIVTYTRF